MKYLDSVVISIVICLMAASIAKAQTPSDADIDQAHRVCQNPAASIATGSTAGPNSVVVRNYLRAWAPNYSFCGAIEAEWSNRHSEVTKEIARRQAEAVAAKLTH